MTPEQTVNLFGSGLALAGALAFVLVYTLSAPWRRSDVGRLLVFKALVIAGFMVVSILAYILDPGSGHGHGLGVLLLVRGVLAGGFGAAMLYQTWLVRRSQVRRTRAATRPPSGRGGGSCS